MIVDSEIHKPVGINSSLGRLLCEATKNRYSAILAGRSPEKLEFRAEQGAIIMKVFVSEENTKRTRSLAVLSGTDHRLETENCGFSVLKELLEPELREPRMIRP